MGFAIDRLIRERFFTKFRRAIEWTARHKVAGSYQPLAIDLNVSATAGSSDTTDPDYIAPIMGNVLADEAQDSAQDANMLAGLIGKYNIPGAVYSKYPVGGVIGEIGEESTNADCPDAPIVAVMGGDSAATRARAYFAARNLNSNAGTGPQYGLDLFDPEAAGLNYQQGAPTKADIRLSNEICIFGGDAAPVDGTSGTGAGFAGPGSLYVRTNSGNIKLFINTNTKASPTWTVVGSQS